METVTHEQYTPLAPAGAELLQLAFENILLGYAEPEDAIAAIETAFRGVRRYGLAQQSEGGYFCSGSVVFGDILGSLGVIGHRPEVLTEHHETGITSIKLRLDEHRNPLFRVFPVHELANQSID